jgi:hypothetical protein
MAAKKDKKEDDGAMGKLYNSVMAPAKDDETVPPISEKKAEPAPKPIDDEAEWLVPAFLRRGKK